MVRDELAIARSTEELTPYHGKPKRADVVQPELREFIGWDGEGMNRHGPNAPQDYVLFGASTGDVIKSSGHLSAFEIFELIIRVGRRHPTAFHVGFSFSYDANMIIRSLSEETKKKLHKEQKVTLRKWDGTVYHVQYMPGKWFSVSKYDANYDRKKNPNAKTTVKIYDIFSFFGCAFIKAYEDLIGPVSDVVVAGKAERGSFDDMERVERYWRVEIDMLRELADALRRNLYGAGLRITQWHGPGALASYTMRQHGIKVHKGTAPKEVRTAASYAYAGGRFEIFRLGRITGPIYAIDINSAYPNAIAKLPSLASGVWFPVTGPIRRVAKFGVYRIRLLPQAGDSFLMSQPGPLFHRDKMGNISFPWILDGWYWSPEVAAMMRHLPPERYEIVEGWEYHTEDKLKPFGFIHEMYETRREWKAQGIPSQLALKLCMNSLYGKMAQRVGWDEEKRRAPVWHQLEWAGWVTSYTRAMLWDVMSRIPAGQLIAVETDGLYTTYNPALLGIEHSKELGGWEVSEYDEILYVQSGMAHLRKGDDWTVKRRGLDARTFERGACEDYLRNLAPRGSWLPYIGETTRFVGLGAALARSQPVSETHCRWEVKEREIRPGQNGKRIHVHGQCSACAMGHTAYERAHDLVIRSLAYKNPRSHPHFIPWESDSDEDYPWREQQNAVTYHHEIKAY